MRRGVFEIGNAHGRIAVYLNEREAINLAHLYGLDDRAGQELMDAVEKAYPKPDEMILSEMIETPQALCGCGHPLSAHRQEFSPDPVLRCNASQCPCPDYREER